MNKTGKTMERVTTGACSPANITCPYSGVVQRPDKKYLITQRKMDKPWGAGWWGVPGGAVRVGEPGRRYVVRSPRKPVWTFLTLQQKVLTYKREDPERRQQLLHGRLQARA